MVVNNIPIKAIDVWFSNVSKKTKQEKTRQCAVNDTLTNDNDRGQQGQKLNKTSMIHRIVYSAELNIYL